MTPTMCMTSSPVTWSPVAFWSQPAHSQRYVLFTRPHMGRERNVCSQRTGIQVTAASRILLTCALLLQPELDFNKVLVVHNASSCTHPANYYHLMKTIVYPYWAADPPEHRLSKKNYKQVDHPTAWVPEDSFAFKVSHPGRPRSQSRLSWHQLCHDSVARRWG